MPGTSLRTWLSSHPAVIPKADADCQALRALFDAARDQDPERLDQLFALYCEYTPESIQERQLDRTVATLKVLIEHDVTPETLQAALSWAARRDLAAQVVAGLIGYTGSWFVGTTVALLMVRQGFRPGTSATASAAVTAVGTRLMTRWLRLADTGPTWRRTVGGFEPDGKPVPPSHTRTGFAVGATAYWPFLTTLWSITAMWAHPARAFTADEARERAAAILDARRMLNYVATVGVALHRYFAPVAIGSLPKPPIAVEHSWLDGRDRPDKDGKPDKIKGEAVLVGAIQELSGGTTSALRGAARSAYQLLTSIPRTLLPCAAERADGRSAPGLADTVAPPPGRLAKDVLMVMGLMLVVAVTSLLRTTASDPQVSGDPHPGEPASMTDYPRLMEFLSDLVLVVLWGFLMTAVDMLSAKTDSITRDSKRVAGERNERLAARVQDALEQADSPPSAGDRVTIHISPARPHDSKSQRS
jgi:hypothetical protein